MSDLPPVTKEQAERDFNSVKCACGAPKSPMQPFCVAHFFRLPLPLRLTNPYAARLDKKQRRVVYSLKDEAVERYNQALKFLGLESAAARADREQSSAEEGTR